MSRQIIALSGWRGNGKDTVADYLVSQYGFTRLSFASLLKDMVAEQYKIPREYMDSVDYKELPLEEYPTIPTDQTTHTIHHLLANELGTGFWTPRALCILEGSIKRAVYPNYWVRRVVESIQESSATKFVISDLRYLSEIDTLKLIFPEIKIWRIQRFDSVDSMDPSERELDTYTGYDIFLQNRGTIDALHSTIDFVLSTAY